MLFPNVGASSEAVVQVYMAEYVAWIFVQSNAGILLVGNRYVRLTFCVYRTLRPPRKNFPHISFPCLLLFRPIASSSIHARFVALKHNESDRVKSRFKVYSRSKVKNLLNVPGNTFSGPPTFLDRYAPNCRSILNCTPSTVGI